MQNTVEKKIPESSLGELAQFEVLGAESFGEILRFLPHYEASKLAEELDNLARQDKERYNNFFDSAARTLHKYWKEQSFMENVSRGNESEVLDNISTFNLSAEIPYCDHAQRNFLTTALKLALTNLDLEMAKIIENRMSKAEVKRQVLELKEKGTDYEIPLEDFNRLIRIAPDIPHPLIKDINIPKGIVTINEKHYDWAFKVFKSAYEAYDDNRGLTYAACMIRCSAPDREDFENIDALRPNVCFALYYATAPFINMYCSEEDPDPSMHKSDFYNEFTDRWYNWFSDYRQKVLDNFFGEPNAEEKLYALTELYEERISEYQEFEERVLGTPDPASLRYAG